MIDPVYKTEYSALSCTGNVSSHSTKIKATYFYQLYKDGSQDLCHHCVIEIKKMAEKARAKKKSTKQMEQQK